MTLSPQPCLAGAYELWLDLPNAWLASCKLFEDTGNDLKIDQDGEEWDLMISDKSCIRSGLSSCQEVFTVTDPSSEFVCLNRRVASIARYHSLSKCLMTQVMIALKL